MANECSSSQDVKVMHGLSNLFLMAEYLPEAKNQVADMESGIAAIGCFILISFSQSERRIGPLEVYMFASQLTHLLPCYFSGRPGPVAEAFT